MELAFAGLHQLCAPMLGHLDRLPGPQRDALSVAFGLSAGSAPDRFLVGLAVLSLLAEVAEEQPLVCVVDDAQWLDQVSAQTLAFVARRLLAERVALVFAVREPVLGPLVALVGLPELVIRGLRDGDAHALLASVVPGRLDDRVRDRIVAETRGNPLALLELPRGLTAAELAGGFGRPDARPLSSQIEQSFLRRIESLPVATRRLLLAAAAEPVGDVPLLRRVAERLSIGPDAAAAAEAAGLIEIGVRVRFRHPLVRSAAYRAADPGDRQEVHRALAEATDPESDPDRRAWHRAHAAVEPDEVVAGELERSADRAQGRGGIAAAVAFLARATELTPDPALRAARALAAAQATFEAAAPDAAYELLTVAEIGPLDPLQRARLERLRAQIVFARRRGSDAAPLLLAAAERLEQLDGGLARETYLEALGAAIFGGRFNGHGGVREAAEAARAAPPAPQPPRPIDFLLDGVAARFTEGYVDGVPKLRHALQSFRQETLRSKEDITRWLWLAYPIAQEAFVHELWDDEAWHELATRAVRLAREAGALTALPIGLVYRAGVHLHAGEFTTASALIEEADAITAATGNAPVMYTSLVLVAWRGEEAVALELIEADVRDATARGEGRVLGMAGYVTAVLYNGLGRYEAALAAAQRACEHEDLGFFGWTLAELVEAAARSGAHEDAAEAVAQLEERTRAAGTDWALGVQARSRALLSEDQEAADGLYREAIERLTRTRMTVHLARAHLVYGEWLRRENRRRDAREQLRIAHEMLHRFGAEAFAERARRELQATGESVRQRAVETREVLTAQEAQIARLAGDGLTNSEIGAQLFISPRTVEWHLRKVFTKLDVDSRHKLRGVLAET
ncbi:regulatory LuxR family protein [Pseudonocardia hierapolitana]|uniref:Regulatory LuxR family protein n=2 Tax=Pseudonocardia hierapolitana TaxID=1128676 RepID=A0A561SJC0_9PSEU|nr:regulatory LuxR family protein [Pseudonocardia hierapolitana]